MNAKFNQIRELLLFLIWKFDRTIHHQKTLIPFPVVIKLNKLFCTN